MVPRAYLILPSQDDKGYNTTKGSNTQVYYYKSMLTMERKYLEWARGKRDDQHDLDVQSLAHGGPGVVDDDQADVDGDKSSPGTQ